MRSEVVVTQYAFEAGPGRLPTREVAAYAKSDNSRSLRQSR